MVLMAVETQQCVCVCVWFIKTLHQHINPRHWDQLEGEIFPEKNSKYVASRESACARALFY